MLTVLVFNPLCFSVTEEFPFFVYVTSAVYKLLFVEFSLAFLVVYGGGRAYDRSVHCVGNPGRESAAFYGNFLGRSSAACE